MHDQYKSCRYLRRGVELKQEKKPQPFRAEVVVILDGGRVKDQSLKSSVNNRRCSSRSKPTLLRRLTARREFLVRSLRDLLFFVWNFMGHEPVV